MTTGAAFMLGYAACYALAELGYRLFF